MILRQVVQIDTTIKALLRSEGPHGFPRVLCLWIRCALPGVPRLGTGMEAMTVMVLEVTHYLGRKACMHQVI